MIDYNFQAEAAAELEIGVEYYDRQRAGLGREFLNEVSRAIHFIRTHPNGSPKISRLSRRCRTHRFPYGVVYQTRNGSVYISAVMDLRRRPGYWKDRDET